MRSIFIGLWSLWLTFIISYSDIQRAVNVLTGEIVVYQSRSDGGYDVVVIHERLGAHSIYAKVQNADATAFDVWKSTCVPILGFRPDFQP